MQNIYSYGFAIFIAVALLSGCAATPKQVADQTVNMSVAIEDANNRMLLLNIVRAYYRLPMQFFRVNALHGTSGVAVPGGTATLPISHFQAMTSFAANYKLDQPTFDLTVLDSQEFMNGITTPLSADTLKYFIEQGWPEELVLHLFVRKLEILDASGNVTTLLNYPANPTNMDAFSTFVHKVAQECEIKFKRTTKKPYGPALEIDSDFPPDKLADTRKNGLEIQEKDTKADDRRFQLVESKTEPIVSFACNSAIKIETVLGHLWEFSTLAPTDRDQTPADPKNRIYMRSVEAMIYYLGELARARNCPDDPKKPCDSRNQPVVIALAPPHNSRKAALFVLDYDVTGDTIVSVEYQNHQFGIPRQPKSNGIPLLDQGITDRSTHVLMLITQLLALQNKATEAPVTGAVRLVN